MAKIVGYQVVQHIDVGRMSDVVIMAMRNGWQPLGGVSVACSIGDEWRYCQAMVKYEDGQGGQDEL